MNTKICKRYGNIICIFRWTTMTPRQLRWEKRRSRMTRFSLQSKVSRNQCILQKLKISQRVRITYCGSLKGWRGEWTPVYGRQKLKKFLKVYSGISFGNLNTVIWVMEIIMSVRPCMRNGANWSYWWSWKVAYERIIGLPRMVSAEEHFNYVDSRHLL